MGPPTEKNSNFDEKNAAKNSQSQFLAIFGNLHFCAYFLNGYSKSTTGDKGYMRDTPVPLQSAPGKKRITPPSMKPPGIHGHYVLPSSHPTWLVIQRLAVLLWF